MSVCQTLNGLTGRSHFRIPSIMHEDCQNAHVTTWVWCAPAQAPMSASTFSILPLVQTLRYLMFLYHWFLNSHHATFVAIDRTLINMRRVHDDCCNAHETIWVPCRTLIGPRSLIHPAATLRHPLSLINSPAETHERLPDAQWAHWALAFSYSINHASRIAAPHM